MLRRAMGAKEKEVMDRLKGDFIDGATAQGYNDEDFDLFEPMVKFAEYGFNKSHSTAYAFISYQTAYLKCHYPQMITDCCFSPR